MFVRPSWRPLDPAAAHRLIDAHPWALLVTNASEGPFATNLPLLLDRSRGAQGVLVGHLARGNAHARALVEPGSRSLAVFEGPWSFVTASWYPNRDMPGTFYYTAVHASGALRIQEEDELERWLGVLNERFEGPIPDGWKMTEVPHSEITRRLPAIVGFEIEIERLEAKFKLGQDEPKKDAMAVGARLAASPDARDRVLAEMILAENAGRPDQGAE